MKLSLPEYDFKIGHENWGNLLRIVGKDLSLSYPDIAEICF